MLTRRTLLAVLLLLPFSAPSGAAEWISAPCAGGSCAASERRLVFWRRAERGEARRPVRNGLRRLFGR